MVPTTSSAKTAIQAPASRGAEPCVASTVTSTRVFVANLV